MVIRFQVNRRVDQCGGSASNTMIFFFILSKRIYFFTFFIFMKKEVRGSVVLKNYFVPVLQWSQFHLCVTPEQPLEDTAVPSDHQD